MRAVTDTNVLLSGLLWRGTPHRLLEHVRDGTLSLVSSPELLSEPAGIITRPRFSSVLARSGTDHEQMLAEVRLLAEIIEPPPLASPISRDPDDNAVLALAGAHEGIPIVTPAPLAPISSFPGMPRRGADIAQQERLNRMTVRQDRPGRRTFKSGPSRRN